MAAQHVMQLAGPVLKAWSENVADPLVAGAVPPDIAAAHTRAPPRPPAPLWPVAAPPLLRTRSRALARAPPSRGPLPLHHPPDEGLDVLRALAGCPRCLPELARHALPTLVTVSASRMPLRARPLRPPPRASSSRCRQRS